MIRAAYLGSLLACLATVIASPAAAQLAAARAHLADADFQRAERAFGRALSEPEITRDELVAIFEGRAVARWALGDEADARADLRALGSLEPEHVLPPEAPPALVETFAALPRQPLSIRLDWEHEDGGAAVVRAAIENDPAELVRAVRIHARRRGELEWTSSTEPELAFRLREGDVVEVWAEAMGPGGAVVAHQGSALAPIEHGDAGLALARPTSVAFDPIPIWVGTGVGAALVVVAIGIAIGVASASSDATQPTAPMVIGF